MADTKKGQPVVPPPVQPTAPPPELDDEPITYDFQVRSPQAVAKFEIDLTDDEFEAVARFVRAHNEAIDKLWGSNTLGKITGEER